MATRVEDIDRIFCQPKVGNVIRGQEINLGPVDEGVDLVYGVFDHQATSAEGTRFFKWVRQPVFALKGEKGISPMVHTADVDRFDEPFRSRVIDRLVSLREEGKI